MTLQLLIDNLPRLLAMAVLIALSGMISASETALFALTRHQLAQLRQSPRRTAQLVLQLRDDPRSLLSTVLLANIAVNILLYAMLGVTVSRLSGGSTAWAVVLGTAGFIIVLIGAEIAPKLLALAARDRLAVLVADPLRIVKLVTGPVRSVLEVVFVEPLTRLLGGTADAAAPLCSAELQEFVDYSRAEGLIDDFENALLHHVMDLQSMRVGAIMVPRVDIIAFDLADERGRLIELIRVHRLLRIPVYEESIDGVIGFIHAKEVLLQPGTPLRSLVRPCNFVPEQARVDDLLTHFRKTRSQIAIVVDEYGGLAGIVALEDIAEAVVGDIASPDEPAVGPPVQRVDDRNYLVDGALDVTDFADAFGVPVEGGRTRTVGGWMAERLDRIPAMGDAVDAANVRIVVTATRGRRVLRVRLTSQDPIPDNPELDRLTRGAAVDGPEDPDRPEPAP